MELYYVKMTTSYFHEENYEMLINAKSIGEAIKLAKESCGDEVISVFVYPVGEKVLFTEDYEDIITCAREQLSQLVK